MNVYGEIVHIDRVRDSGELYIFNHRVPGTLSNGIMNPDFLPLRGRLQSKCTISAILRAPPVALLGIARPPPVALLPRDRVNFARAPSRWRLPTPIHPGCDRCSSVARATQRHLRNGLIVWLWGNRAQSAVMHPVCSRMCAGGTLCLVARVAHAAHESWRRFLRDLFAGGASLSPFAG